MMTTFMSPYVSVNLIAAILSGLLVLVTLQTHDRRGRLLAALMSTAMIAAAAAAAGHATGSIPEKVIWARIQYIGGLAAPLLALLYAAMLAGRADLLTRRSVALLSIPPIAIWLVILTNEWHHLIWTGFTPSPADSNLVIFERGPAWYIMVAGYIYPMLVATSIFLVRWAFRPEARSRLEAGLTLLAAALPWLVNILYVLHIAMIPGLEPSTPSLALSGLLFTGAYM
ncbi:MAG: hypothetical protein IT326_10280, partial [Anaerolineae bacterium]|nr:hypothetical protein [Anaerolineae bacterium]